jgi:hypothetical protein
VRQKGKAHAKPRRKNAQRKQEQKLRWFKNAQTDSKRYRNGGRVVKGESSSSGPPWENSHKLDRAHAKMLVPGRLERG